jgi:hypothetical protein
MGSNTRAPSHKNLGIIGNAKRCTLNAVRLTPHVEQSSVMRDGKIDGSRLSASTVA